MNYRRVHFRVPIEGQAHLFCRGVTAVKARTIDISHAGVAVSIDSDTDLPHAEYRVEVTLVNGTRIKLNAELVRQTETVAAFRAIDIDQENWNIIRDLVFSYQETDDFIRQLEEQTGMDKYLVDESGNEIDISFSIDPEEP